MGMLDFALAALILVALVLAVRTVIRAGKQGKTCGGDCSRCSGCTGRNDDTAENPKSKQKSNG